MIDSEELQQLALRMSAFADVLGEHASRLVEETGQSTLALRNATQGLGVQAHRLSQEVVQTISRESRGAIERGVAEAMRDGSDQLRSAGDLARQTADAMQQELARLRAAHRSLVWKAGAALIVGALLAAGGSIYLVWQSNKALKLTEFPRDLLQATESGAITRCGDALCARIGKQPMLRGQHKEYAEVR